MSQIDVLALLKDWTAGDEEAAREIFERYSRRLTALAEKQLSHRLAQRLDGEDIVQSVFRTFFARSARGEFQVNASVNLWQLLVTITLAKVRSQARRHVADKRNVGAEAGDGREWLSQIAAAGPSAEEAAILVEQMELLLKGLPDTYAEILQLRLNGESRSDIAGILGISRQTVYRSLNLMCDRLKELETGCLENEAGP
jgi:RNA polymerase sigma factor (sigma-70 family)